MSDAGSFVIAVIVSYAFGSMHAIRSNVPAYTRWGVDPTSVCGYTPIPLNKLSASEMDDPIASASSMIYATVGYLIAKHTSRAGELFMFLSILAVGSSLMHTAEYPGSRELDHYMSITAPIAVVTTFKPLWMPTLTVLVLSLLYMEIADEFAIGITGGVIGVLSIGYLAIYKQYRPQLASLPVVVAAVACAVTTKDYGNKLDTICANDVPGAFVNDAAHSAWHISTAVLVWLGATWILTGDVSVIIPRYSWIPITIALLIPIGFTFTHDHVLWIVCISLQTVSYIVWWYLARPSSADRADAKYSKLNT